MAANSLVRKNHLEKALRASHSEVLTLNAAAEADIDALNNNLNLLLPFYVNAGLRVNTTNGKIYQV